MKTSTFHFFERFFRDYYCTYRMRSDLGLNAYACTLSYVHAANEPADNLYCSMQCSNNNDILLLPHNCNTAKRQCTLGNDESRKRNREKVKQKQLPIASS